MLEESSTRYPGWRVVFVCFVMAVLCWGFGFYGHGFYLAELHGRFGWPTGLIAGASTVYYLVSALLVVYINDLIRVFGIRGSVLAGAGALALSVALIPLVSAPWQLFAAYLVMACAWATLSVGAITNIVGLWFDRRRGLAISLALTGASFGGIAVVPALVFLAQAIGFQRAMLTGAGLILVILVPLALLVLGPPARSAPDPAGRTSEPARDRAPVWTRAAALRSLAFWSVSAPFALGLMSQAGFLVHQIAFLEPTIGRGAAGVAVGITTAMAVAGRLMLGPMANRLDQRLASAGSLASQAAALAVMANSADTSVLWAACAVYGLSVGNLITLPALIVQREFDAASFGMLIGLSTAISQFTYAFGPGLLGLVRDLSGTYAASLFLCIILNLTAAVIVLRRPGGSAVHGRG
jgi:MFS family permease